MKEINLYLVRHGQTEWNIQDRMQGSLNSPLTQQGIDGAKITGHYLANTPFVRAYSSTQQRAIETRDYILAEHNPALGVVPAFELASLMEMDFGRWEGQPVKVLSNLPEFKIYIDEPEKFDASMSGGEDLLAVLARMQQSLDRIVTETPTSGNVLVVSHGMVLRLLLCVLNGGDWRKHRQEGYFPRTLNTSISIVNYQQTDNQHEGHYRLAQYNSVSHLTQA